MKEGRRFRATSVRRKR